MLIWRIAASLIPLAAVLAAVAPQAPPFRSRTDLVAMTITVFDEKGVPVPKLPEAAFAVTEDGRPRPIAHFAYGMLPLTIVVALDASESMKGGRFDRARQAVKGFLDQLGPEDELTLIAFNDKPFSVAPWSTSPDAIFAALTRVEPQGYTALYAGGVDRARRLPRIAESAAGARDHLRRQRSAEQRAARYGGDEAGGAATRAPRPSNACSTAKRRSTRSAWTPRMCRRRTGSTRAGFACSPTRAAARRAW